MVGAAVRENAKRNTIIARLGTAAVSRVGPFLSFTLALGSMATRGNYTYEYLFN